MRFEAHELLLAERPNANQSQLDAEPDNGKRERKARCKMEKRTKQVRRIRHLQLNLKDPVAHWKKQFPNVNASSTSGKDASLIGWNKADCRRWMHGIDSTDCLPPSSS